jgi:hypothetical protein
MACGVWGDVMRRVFAAGCAVVLAGCASKSEDVAPTYVSPLTYQSFTCPQIGEEAQRVSAQAAQVAGVQDSNHTKDIVATTVGVLIVWPALFLNHGDNQTTAQLALLKGQMDALQQESIRKNCGFQFQTAPPPKT